MWRRSRVSCYWREMIILGVLVKCLLIRIVALGQISVLPISRHGECVDVCSWECVCDCVAFEFYMKYTYRELRDMVDVSRCIFIRFCVHCSCKRFVVVYTNSRPSSGWRAGNSRKKILYLDSGDDRLAEKKATCLRWEFTSSLMAVPTTVANMIFASGSLSMYDRFEKLASTDLTALNASESILFECNVFVFLLKEIC